MTFPSTHPLQLYRALLRECTYLPDPRARKYFHDYVVSSFRVHLPKKKQWRKKIPLQHQVTLLARGRKNLSFLRRANEGYPNPLEKVLMTTYGRIGKRRQVLVESLVAQEVPQDHHAVNALSTAPTQFSKEWRSPAVLDTLIRSQAAHYGQFDKVKGKVKPKPIIPERTTWGRMLPESRYKNAMKKWYERQKECLLPPLPENEWMELHALATGRMRWDGPIQKRTPAIGSDGSKKSPEISKVLLEGPEKGPTFQRYRDGRPHKLTHRLMRRSWGAVLKHTPLLRMHPVKGGLTAIWTKSDNFQPRLVVPDFQQTGLLFGN